MGMVVEAVSDVHDVSEQEHKPPPEMRSRNVRGLAMVDDKTVIVLDVDRLLDPRRV